MRAVLPFLTVTLLLAGCADPAPTNDDVAPAAATDSMTSMPTVPVQLPDEVVPVSFDGNLGTFAYVFEGASGQGHFQEVVAGENSISVERPGMLLVAAELVLTWQATTPAAQTLAFELMAMGPNSTDLAAVTGPTGLTISVSGISVPLDSETVAHAYFYNPATFLHNDPVYAGTSIDEAVHIEGTMTFRPVPAPLATSSVPAG